MLCISEWSIDIFCVSNNMKCLVEHHFTWSVCREARLASTVLSSFCPPNWQSSHPWYLGDCSRQKESRTHCFESGTDGRDCGREKHKLCTKNNPSAQLSKILALSRERVWFMVWAFVLTFAISVIVLALSISFLWSILTLRKLKRKGRRKKRIFNSMRNRQCSSISSHKHFLVLTCVRRKAYSC